MSEAIQKKLDQMSDIIVAIQSKNDENEKKYDGLLNNQIKSLTDNLESVTKQFEETKKSEEVEKELKKEIENLEKTIARSHNAKDQKSETDEILTKYNEAFLKYLRKGTRIDSDLSKKAIMASMANKGVDGNELEAKTLQVGINPEGGYWVMPQRLAQTVSRVYETSPVRAVANVITTTSDSVELIIDDDESTSQGAVSELTTRSQTAEPDIGLLSIYTHEKSTLHKITQKLLDDAGFDVGSWLLGKINRKLNRLENTDFVSGNGVNKAKGFLDYSAWSVAGTYESNKIEQVNSGDASALTADGLINLQNALIEDYQSNASWMMRRASWGAVIKLKEAATGAYLIDPQLLRNGSGQLMLLGNPVVFAADMPAVGAGNLAICYGDFSLGYTIVDKVGIKTIRDEITDKGRVIFYVSKRVGGAVTSFDALKIQKVSA